MESNALKWGERSKAISAWILGHIYPIVIALASLLVLIFVPMIGSNASIESIIPTEPTEAFLYWTIKALTVALNLAIFAAFRAEAKVQIKDHPNFVLANQLLAKVTKPTKPLSPRQFTAKQWITKGLTLALSTAVTSMALTNIVLYYDWVTAVSCLITIIIAVIFGLMNMSSEEVY